MASFDENDMAKSTKRNSEIAPFALIGACVGAGLAMSADASGWGYFFSAWGGFFIGIFVGSVVVKNE